MPKAWSNKRERQYEHIKRSEKRQGRSAGTAKRIAAATVNKTRRKKGETRGSSRTRRSARAGSSRGKGRAGRKGSARSR